jgi:serine/threonine-protein kinase
VARQAASSLTTTVHQPVPADHQHSGVPMNRPFSGAPSSAPPGRPVSGHPASGQARPPYPSVPRPVSSGQARGAASVPQAPQQSYSPPGHPQPGHPQPGHPQPGYPRPPQLRPQPQQTAASPPQGGRRSQGGRQVLVVLAVVLALLVLLCAGVISALAKQQNLLQGPAGTVPDTAVVHAGVITDELPDTSYRLMKQADSLTHASEGRHTL